MSILNTFIEDCKRTESGHFPLGNMFDGTPYLLKTDRLLHAAMGMTTESGEFLDPLKKHLFYGKPLDSTNLKEELGDLLWYIAIACDALDTTIEDEMIRVINKLKTRFPDKFSSDHAIHRDLTAERKALEE